MNRSRFPFVLVFKKLGSPGQQFQRSWIFSEKDAVTLDIHFMNNSDRVGFPVKCKKGVLDIQLKITNCEVVFLKIKMFKENLDYQ